MTNRNHPVRQLYDWIAMGGKPTPVDLELLPTSLRERVRRDARAFRALQDDGERNTVRRLATERAEALIDALPEDWTPPGPAEPEPSDPQGLAEGVSRW